MYVARDLADSLAKAVRRFPAVLLTGPRQSGKTTLVRNELRKGFSYVSLDDPLQREFARVDPNGFLDQHGDAPLVLDEVQYAPGLLAHVKARIDQNRGRTGRYVLTGSQQFSVMRDVTESLAGRVAVLDLLPFSIAERLSRSKVTLPHLLWTGLYPEPALHPVRRDMWLRGYIETYVQRDVRQLLTVRDLTPFESFVQMCAAVHGQELHVAELSRRCGMTQPTVKAWLGVLQASYLVHLVLPYFSNLGKRLVKAPKMYFLDPALASYLTRQPSPDAAVSGAMGGALFEGLIAAEAVKAYTSLGMRPDVFFWRSQDGLEVDLLVQARGGLVPVEVKLTATPSARHVEPMDTFLRLAGDSKSRGVLVCRVKSRTMLPNGHMALPWNEFPAFVRRLLLG